MSQSLSHCLIHTLIDWLIAFCGASLLLWFFVTQPVFIDSPKQKTQTVDIEALKEHVLLLTGTYSPRTINNDNLNDTADYIYQQFAKLGIPEYQNIKTLSKQYRNVSLQLGPDTEELYVVGAHYDAKDDSINSEGNASGVATLIELARHLAKNEQKLKVGVILIAYPLSLNQSDNVVNTGSYFHSLALKKKNKKIRLMISLDSVGQEFSEKNKSSNPYRFMNIIYPPNNNHLNLVGRMKDFVNIRELKKGFSSASSLSLYTQTLFENYNKTESSDHVNYWKQGYPAVLISGDLHSAKAKKNRSINDPKSRINYEKMGMLVNSLYQAIVQTNASDSDITYLTQRSRNKKLKSSL